MLCMYLDSCQPICLRVSPHCWEHSNLLSLGEPVSNGESHLTMSLTVGGVGSERQLVPEHRLSLKSSAYIFVERAHTILLVE